MDLPTFEPAPWIMIARAMLPSCRATPCKRLDPQPGKVQDEGVARRGKKKPRRMAGSFAARSCVQAASACARGIAAFAFFARQRDRGAHALGYKVHQARHDTLVGVDPGARQHFAAVARTRPAGDLLRAVAIFLVVGNGVIQRSQNDGCKSLRARLPCSLLKAVPSTKSFMVRPCIIALVFSACSRLWRIRSIRIERTCIASMRQAHIKACLVHGLSPSCQSWSHQI